MRRSLLALALLLALPAYAEDTLVLVVVDGKQISAEPRMLDPDAVSFSVEEWTQWGDQHVRQLSKGAGVCDDELPWVALAVNKKIGYLKKGWQDADKLSRDGHQDAYEKEAKYLYGLLREAWERALEEVLLDGLVERYRPDVQTKRIARIADITPEDCKTVETAMTKCSAWLPGHDKAAAARAPVPGQAELKADIEALESWVAAIRHRR